MIPKSRVSIPGSCVAWGHMRTGVDAPVFSCAMGRFWTNRERTSTLLFMESQLIHYHD